MSLNLTQDQNSICIRSQAKRNSLTTLVISIILLLAGWVWISWLGKDLALPGYFVVAAGIVGLFLAWSKISQPQYSLILHRDFLQYQHKYGQWTLNWQDIQRVDQPRKHDGLSQQPLNFLAIKLKRQQSLLSSISLRLASNLLLQQRHLLLFGDNENCSSGQCYAENLLEKDTFTTEEGVNLTGIQAMFARRMQRLRVDLGYDLYIEANELDRPVEEIVTLLRQCISAKELEISVD
ncbi:DUF2982 domain-containing protein [Neptunicella sp. SCSIO 80796]|uniref:DUF2982 domain-containing protein n=1 Tax=Neptunicella plasticusilytica TaxID=3117012 RepID=UPI003A4E13DE